LCYDVVAGTFHTRNFVAEFIRFKLIFIHKMTNLLFEPPFGGLRGNMRTSKNEDFARIPGYDLNEV